MSRKSITVRLDLLKFFINAKSAKAFIDAG